MRTTGASLLLLALWGCDADHDGAGADTDDRSGAADTAAVAAQPVVDEVLPGLTTSDGLLYLFGRDLIPADGTPDDVVVTLLDADGATVGELVVLDASPDRLTVRVPKGAHDLVPDGAKVAVTTEGGTAAAPELFYVVADTGLGPAPLVPGVGLLGRIYALVPGTEALPALGADPCDAPEVDDAFACPHTSVIVPTVDVPPDPLPQGFPGPSAALSTWLAVAFSGTLEVPSDGTWTFTLCSDEDARLVLDPGTGPVPVAASDGAAGARCDSVELRLRAGAVPLRVDALQGPDEAVGVTLRWTRPNGVSEVVPATALKPTL